MRCQTFDSHENILDELFLKQKFYITSDMITILSLIILTLTITLILFVKLLINAYYDMLEHQRQTEITLKENARLRHLVSKVDTPVVMHGESFVNAFPEDKTIKLYHR